MLVRDQFRVLFPSVIIRVNVSVSENELTVEKTL